jgi:hypothetical protein
MENKLLSENPTTDISKNWDSKSLLPQHNLLSAPKDRCHSSLIFWAHEILPLRDKISISLKINLDGFT